MLAASDYSKLPPSPPCDQVFLLDPLIATGGTALAAMAMITEWGIPGAYSVLDKGTEEVTLVFDSQ
jgi:uracil phosphoribosyltransferase